MEEMTIPKAIFTGMILLFCVSALVLPAAWIGKIVNMFGNLIQKAVGRVRSLFS